MKEKDVKTVDDVVDFIKVGLADIKATLIKEIEAEDKLKAKLKEGK